MADEPNSSPDGELNPDGTKKRDLRYTAHEEANVRIERSMDGSGHLARGDRTKMSSLKFSSRHQARTERDPDFEFRPPPAKPAEAAPAEAKIAPPAEPAAAAPPGSDPAAESSLVDRFKKMLGW
jgi:uncharacterized membrane protein